MAINADHEARLRDWLDDKLQTLSDLESLDKLLLNVRESHTLFLKQLDDAKTELTEAREASAEHQKHIQQTRAESDKEHKNVQDRMMHVTQSSSAREASEKFEATRYKLQQLDLAASYIDILKQVDASRNDCLKNLKSSDSTALDAYSNIHILLSRIEAQKDTDDGTALLLAGQIRAATMEIREKIETVLMDRLNSLLKKLQWPKNADQPIPTDLQPEFTSVVGGLLKLQKPDIESHEHLNEGVRSVQPLVLLPLRALIEPLELGFRYHFDRENVMNRLDKPELYLAHITERILSKYVDFIDANIQPLLLQEFRGTDLDMNLAYVDATSAFITSLLPMVRTKSLSVLKQVSKKPAMLSHLIHELMKFDTELRDEWQYDGGARSETWQGITGEILSKDDVFSAWLQAEKEYTLSRYHAYVDADDSFELDFDSFGEGKTKPSKAAIRVNNLLEGVTDNYRELVTFQYKLRFLLDVQVAIFDLFHRRLEDSYIAYFNRTSAITRVSKEDQASLQGVEGLKRLCRIFGSADYLEKAMQDWNDDTFFLELWSELQHRALSTKPNQTLGSGSLTLADVASQTSKSLQNGAVEGQDIFEGGALFDETTASYDRIRSKTETAITDLLASNVRNALSAYTRINPWSSLAPASEGSLSTTAELDSLLQVLTSLVGYLKRAVGTAPLHKMVKSALQRIDEILYDRIIKERMFSASGALQFSTDLNAIASLVARLVEDRAVVQSGLARINQANLLLNLPLVDKKDAEDSNESTVGLLEAHNKIVSPDGDEAKELLEELGIDRLGKFEAGRVLVRRIELGN